MDVGRRQCCEQYLKGQGVQEHGALRGGQEACRVNTEEAQGKACQVRRERARVSKEVRVFAEKGKKEKRQVRRVERGECASS